MSNRNGDETLLWIYIGFLLFIGIWTYIKITEFAAFAHLDFDSAFQVLRNLAILCVVVVVCIWQRWFRLVAPYLVAALFLCMIPAFDFWSWNYVLTDAAQRGGFLAVSHSNELLPLNSEPDWYGKGWIQAIIFLVFLAAGYGADRHARKSSY